MKNFYIAFYLLFFAFNINVNAQSTIIKSFNSQNSWNDYANGALITRDGGIIIAGTIQDSLVQSNRPQSGFLVKLDSSLNIIWAKEYFSGFINIFSITTTDDAGYLLIGWKSSSHLNAVGSYVIKTDSAGNLQWSKVYEGNGAFNICKTNDYGYVFTAQSLTAGPVLQYSIVSLTKIDSSGNMIWNHSYVPISAPQGDLARSVKQTLDNGFIVSGINGVGNSASMYLIKVDSIGNLIWAKTFYETGHNDAFDIIISADSGFVVVGASGGSPSILKTDKDGNFLWGKKYSAASYFSYGDCRKIINTIDGGYLMLNEMNGSTGLSNLLWKLDSIGNTEWVKQLNELPNESENVCFSLLNTLTSKFIVVSSNKTNNNDLYVASIDTLHDLCILDSISYRADTFMPSVQNITFTINNLTQQNYVITPSSNLLFTDSIICEDPLTTSSNGLVPEINKLNVYPNPFTFEISLSIQKQNKNEAVILIRNIFGQTVFLNHENNPNGPYTKSIDLSFLPKGVYFLYVLVDGERTVSKIVKE